MWLRAVLWTSTGSVLYVVVGYPVVAWILARTRPRPVRHRAHEPTVAVIVPCHNEADVITAKLANVRALDYPEDRLEVVVVDDGSTDGTAGAARVADPDVRVIELPARSGKAVAVNAGVTSTTGEIVVLSDATALLEPAALKALVRNFADPEVGAVSGRIAYRPGGVSQGVSAYWRLEDRLRTWESASGSTVGVNGDLFAVRRPSFLPLPEGTINDELALALQAAARGERVVYEPDAVATDIASQSMTEERQRRTRITAGRVQAVRGPARQVWRAPAVAFRLVSHKLLRPVIPVAGASALVAATVTLLGRRQRPRTDVALSRVICVGGASLVALAGGAAALERAGRPVPATLRLPQLLVSASLASVSGLIRAARGTQSAIWRKRVPVSLARVSEEPAGDGSSRTQQAGQAVDRDPPVDVDAPQQQRARYR
jgi:cellulose synthase/poly-beta-1,6-N-acetylglucosamine synthase-like glycosyltransferase